ncbi:MAG: hypothetical protein PHH82_01215 [Candidatus ainarchaeum sp.]|nr:hypothetical protein [Candidatus ainarchaeum sp.]
MVYTGPVIFIVHSPLPPTSRTVTRGELEHEKRMFRLVEFANKYNIPVIFGVGDYYQFSRWEFRDGQRHKTLIGSCNKPIITELQEMKYALDFSPNPENHLNVEWERNILSAIEQHEIRPSKIIMGGWYREICMERVQKILRKLFPKSQIVELRGHSSYSKVETNRHFCDLKKKHTEERQKLGIRRAVLARKILK